MVQNWCSFVEDM